MKGAKRHSGTPLAAGCLLLAVFVGGLFFTGQIINRIATTMSRHIVRQIGDSHFRLIDNELHRGEEQIALLRSCLLSDGKIAREEAEVLTRALLRSDSTISQLRIDRTLRADTPDEQLWQTTDTVCTPAGECYAIHMERPLQRLYDHLSEIEPLRRSYAVVFDASGRIIYHPDRGELGRRIRLPQELIDKEGITDDFEGRIPLPLEEYLGLEQDHIFYPLQMGGQRWIAMVGIPTLTIRQEIGAFHRYTLLTALLAVVAFALLLLFAQRRWRREYDLRRQSQTESHRLQLQRIMDRIDPHFLFNSLNSLYVLIRTDAALAREFTLSLSKVYRHVLERREQQLCTLADELGLCREYYKLQKIRFGGNISLSVELPPEWMTRRLPAMTLQTLVENAVKHNSITPATPLDIRIHARGEQIIITNNRTPRDEEDNSLGVGLESIRSIYRFYTDRKVEIEADKYRFECRLPLF